MYPIVFEPGKGIRSASEAWYQYVQHLDAGGNSSAAIVLATNGPFKGLSFTLKIFQQIDNKERQEKFLAEIAFLRKSDHPSIVRVFDTGIYRMNSGREFPFVVSEYLPLTLREVIAGGQASEGEKLLFALQLSSALAYIHGLERPVIHRDIKPENILVKGRDAVLADFGLMKIMEPGDEEDKQIFKKSLGPGMPFLYRTPDLVAYAKNEADITVASDVFQLGVVLAELFTGQPTCSVPRDILDPVVLLPIKKIDSEDGGLIVKNLRLMLDLEPTTRIRAADVIDRWNGLLQLYINRCIAKKCRAF